MIDMPFVAKCSAKDTGKCRLVAELEAKATKMQRRMANAKRVIDDLEKLLKKDRAELAALKERRCEGCAAHYDCRIEEAGTDWFTKPQAHDFACNRWAERGTG